MANLVLLLVCYLAGIVLRKTNRAGPDAHRVVSAIIVNIALPAMALTYLHQMRWNASVFSAILMPWSMFVIASALFMLIGKRLNWPKEVLGALILLGGLGNTSFVGIPIVEATYGRSGIPLAMIIDQAGSYLALSTLGLAVAAYCAADKSNKTSKTSLKDVGIKISTYPPFIAMTLALLLIPFDYPAAVATALLRISDTVAPLALLSLGMQLSLKGISELKKPLAAGLTYKLLVCPVIVLAVYALFGAKMGMQGHVILLESAMGPSIGAGIIATQAELKPQLVNLLLGIGIPASILSAPLINLVASMSGA